MAGIVPQTMRSIIWILALGISAGALLQLDAFHQSADEIDVQALLVPDASITGTGQGCPQVNALFPLAKLDLDTSLNALYLTEAFRGQTFAQLGGAIKIPTESYDDFKPVGQDSRWDVFRSFHQYLESTFPSVYRTLDVTPVNTYALVFHWQGSDTSLKPVLFAAHQDVVPVDPTTVDQWTHPPYSGHFDGTWIWGRGSVDDKADLISQLITVTELLKAGFKPKRTIVFALGIDEEASGLEGAGKLAVFLENTYGAGGFAMLVDEGDGFEGNEEDSVIFAMPGIAEKGYLDVRVEVSSPGGHSSVPPEHTSIGILSMLVVELEKNRHRPVLERTGTGFAYAECNVLYDEKYPPALRTLARKALTDDRALKEFMDALISFDKMFGVILKTTQAVDLITGGIKVNALPEVAAAVVNHRIADHSSSAAVQQHIVDIVVPIAKQLNMSIDAFGTRMDFGDEGTILLEDAFDSVLEPSPVSPMNAKGPYGILSGTIKATLESSSQYKASGVVVSPSLGLGNTDTRFYWNLTDHIFRYSHRADLEDIYNGLHTVNEAIRGDAIIEEIRFFTKLILNLDETGDL